LTVSESVAVITNETRSKSAGSNGRASPAGCGNHQAAEIGFRGLKARIDGQLVEAVAIYVGGRTGPDAARGRQILDVVPCDEALPDVVAKVISDFEKQDQSPIAAEKYLPAILSPQDSPLPAAPESSLPID